MDVYGIFDRDDPQAVDVFVRKEDAERFLEEVRQDEPDTAAALRVERITLDA